MYAHPCYAMPWHATSYTVACSDHLTRYQEFGDWLQSCYAVPIASAGNQTVAQGGNVSLSVASAGGAGGGAMGATIDRVVIMEDQTRGERVRAWSVSVVTPTLTSTVVASGTSVGHKRIAIFDKPVSGVTEVTLTVSSAVAPAGAGAGAGVGGGGDLAAAADPPSADIASLAVFNCSRTPTPTGCSYQQDFQYKIVKSITISTLAGVTLPACCDACRAQTDCAVFTLTQSPSETTTASASTLCTLLSANQGGSTIKGAISGSPDR